MIDFIIECIPQIESLLEDKDKRIRRFAVRTLGDIGEKYPELIKKTALPSMIKLLEHKGLEGLDVALSLGKII